MIEVPTVLVLGAGASSHVRYPLGAQLVSQLCKLRGTGELDSLPDGWTRGDAEALLTKLSRSAHYSIDAFLESNKDMAPLGKFLMARELKKHEDADALFPPNDSGWYQYLFNALIGDGSISLGHNKLTVVTFNYDRSLEAYIHLALMNRFGLSSADAAASMSQLPIIHVHGILGAYPDVPYQTNKNTEDLFKISESIQIIHEVDDVEDGFCNPMFEKASAAIGAASRIYFLGFGFHRDSLRRFRIFSPDRMSDKILRSTTFQLQALERESRIASLAELGFTKEAFPFNSANCDYFFRRTAHLE